MTYNIVFRTLIDASDLSRERRQVEPGDCEGEGPELPLPGPPQPGVQATAVHVDHHQDGGHVADTGCQSSNTRSRSVEESLRSLL